MIGYHKSLNLSRINITILHKILDIRIALFERQNTQAVFDLG
nr:MAG TPA: hypothetical protein [Caudoviricetes sp.]